MVFFLFLNQAVWTDDSGNQKNNIVDSIETLNRTSMENIRKDVIVACNELMDTVSKKMNETHELLSVRIDNLRNDYEKINATIDYITKQARKKVRIIIL